MAQNPRSMVNRPDDAYLPLRQVMDRLFSESFLLPSFFSDSASAGMRWTAAAGTNLWETADGYILQIAVPGMKADSINATIEQNVLTLKAESAVPAPEKANALWQSIGGGANYRIQLPGEVESSKVEATYEAGILTLNLPKVARARTQTIKVVAK
jgi:HSP20 family protein